MVSRDDLYKLVWAQPMTKVSEQFGVSGSYMARVCDVLNVPRPERGYWAKLAVGKAPPQAPLPDAQPGDQLHWSQDGQFPKTETPRRAPPPRVRAKGAAKTQIAKATTHRLILGARQHFENSRRIDDGAYLRPYKHLLVDINASKPTLEAALAFANDLFNAFETRGHQVTMAPPDQRLGRDQIDEREVPAKQKDRYDRSTPWSPQRPTVVYVGDVAIWLSIVEMSEEVVVRYVSGQYVRERDYGPPGAVRGYPGHTWTTDLSIRKSPTPSSKRSQFIQN